MNYQYDQLHDLSVAEDSKQYNVTITPVGASEVLGSDGKLVWEIPKHTTRIKINYTSGDVDNYFYIPFIRDYNSRTGNLDYYLDNGSIVSAENLDYCESRRYSSPLVDYRLYPDSLGVVMYLGTSLNPAYYGADLNTWQMHYLLRDDLGISMVFYG